MYPQVVRLPSARSPDRTVCVQVVPPPRAPLSLSASAKALPAATPAPSTEVSYCCGCCSCRGNPCDPSSFSFVVNALFRNVCQESCPQVALTKICCNMCFWIIHPQLPWSCLVWPEQKILDFEYVSHTNNVNYEYPFQIAILDAFLNIWHLGEHNDEQWGDVRLKDPLCGQPRPSGNLRTVFSYIVVLMIECQVTEELILALFSQIGPVKGCKIIREPGSKSTDDAQCVRTFPGCRQWPLLFCGVCSPPSRQCSHHCHEQTSLHGQGNEGVVCFAFYILSSFMWRRLRWTGQLRLEEHLNKTQAYTTTYSLGTSAPRLTRRRWETHLPPLERSQTVVWWGTQQQTSPRVTALSVLWRSIAHRRA